MYFCVTLLIIDGPSARALDYEVCQRVEWWRWCGRSGMGSRGGKSGGFSRESSKGGKSGRGMVRLVFGSSRGRRAGSRCGLGVTSEGLQAAQAATEAAYSSQGGYGDGRVGGNVRVG